MAFRKVLKLEIWKFLVIVNFVIFVVLLHTDTLMRGSSHSLVGNWRVLWFDHGIGRISLSLSRTSQYHCRNTTRDEMWRWTSKLRPKPHPPGAWAREVAKRIAHVVDVRIALFSLIVGSQPPGSQNRIYMERYFTLYHTQVFHLYL